MMTFGEFILYESPVHAPPQNMGYNNKEDMKVYREYVKATGALIDKFKNNKLYKLTTNNTIRMCLLNDVGVVYESVFDVSKSGYATQTSVWRDKDDKKSEGIVEYVIFNIILGKLKLNLMSDQKQTLKGNRLWIDKLIITALERGYKCTVINILSGVEEDVTEENTANAYSSDDRYRNIRYVIYNKKR